jgi:hypothetical protein
MGKHILGEASFASLVTGPYHCKHLTLVFHMAQPITHALPGHSTILFNQETIANFSLSNFSTASSHSICFFFFFFFFFLVNFILIFAFFSPSFS